ncbi:restriction endonuclease subunit S [Bacillus subtilis]
MSKTSLEELVENVLVPVEEQPYELPENWVWAYLDIVSKEIKNGTTIKQNKDGLGVKVTRIESVQNYKIDLDRIGYIEDVDLIRENDYYQPDDIVLSHINSIEHVGKTSLIKEGYLPLVHGMNLLRIRLFKEKVSPIYSQYYMRSYQFRKDVWERVNRAVNQVSLNIKNLKEIPIPVAPLKEQNRLTEKVEGLLYKIDVAKQLIEEAKTTFELRRASILDKAFSGELTKNWREQHSDIESADDLYERIINLTKPNKVERIESEKYTIPANWKWVRLGEVVQINPPKKKLVGISDEKICTFIPMPAVSDKTGKIENPEEREYIKVKKGYTFFLENDVLFAKITPCMENGKSAIAKNLKNGFGFGSTEFHVIRTSEYINEKYIHYLVRSQKFRLEAKGEMTGAVGQQRVPKEFLINYHLPLPPKEEQDAIVRILDDILIKDECSKLNLEMESKLEFLKQSILSKAFRGELGTNDPNEESAIDLLKGMLQEQLK